MSLGSGNQLTPDGSAGLSNREKKNAIPICLTISSISCPM